MDKEIEGATYGIFEQQYKDFHINEPIGTLQETPFLVQRTHKNNLPVYTQFKLGGQQKRTIIRNVTGDMNEFIAELSKIVSNTEVH